MNNKYFPFLLPFRCLIFLLVFVTGSVITGRTPDALSNIWSVVASVVNIVTILLLVIITRKSGGYAKLIRY